MRVADEAGRTGFWTRTHGLYVVLIAFGLERLGEGTYSVWFSPPIGPELKNLANMTVLVAVGLWGARLFWSATNIERYTNRQDIPDATKAARVIGFHFPVLLGQSAVFFIVCEAYRTMVVPLLIGQPTSLGTAENFAILVMVSLVYNSAWLVTLVWPVSPKNNPEVHWIGNNLLFAGLIGLAAFVAPRIPVPDVSYSLLIYGVLLLMNSIADFVMTGRIYLDS